MKSWKTTLIAAVLCTGSAVGQHELVPEVGILGEFDRYDLKLREVFSEAYKPDVVLRTLGLGGMEEVALFVDAHGNVVSLKTKDVTVWSHEHRELVREGKIKRIDDNSNQEVSAAEETEEEKRIPKLLSGIKLQRESQPLPKELRVALEDVWKDAILHATYLQDTSTGLDGARFHFSMWIYGRGIVSGRTYAEGNAKTLPNALTDIVVALSQYASSGTGTKELASKIENYRNLAKKRIEAGTSRPATRPEPSPEDGQKSQHESEGHPR